jgi:hypothetical protein
MRLTVSRESLQHLPAHNAVTLKLEAACSSDTSASTQYAAWSQNPGDCCLINIHRTSLEASAIWIIVVGIISLYLIYFLLGVSG